jgi:putative hydrolase of the HAD superfamily
MASEIKTIIFDIGSVLIKPNEIYVMTQIAKTLSVNRKKLIKIGQGRLEYDLVTDKISSEVFCRKLCHAFKKKYDKKVLDIWRNKYNAPVKKDVLNLISLLKKKYVVASITNVSKDRVLHHKKLGLYRPFRFVVFSYSVREAKPGKKIYYIALRKLRCAPKECIFVDDKMKNVMAARKIGMKAIQFRNSKQLKKSLKKYGVSVK